MTLFVSANYAEMGSVNTSDRDGSEDFCLGYSDKV